MNLTAGGERSLLYVDSTGQSFVKGSYLSHASQPPFYGTTGYYDSLSFLYLQRSQPFCIATPFYIKGLPVIMLFVLVIMLFVWTTGYYDSLSFLYLQDKVGFSEFADGLSVSNWRHNHKS